MQALGGRGNEMRGTCPWVRDSLVVDSSLRAAYPRAFLGQHVTWGRSLQTRLGLGDSTCRLQFTGKEVKILSIYDGSQQVYGSVSCFTHTMAYSSSSNPAGEALLTVFCGEMKWLAPGQESSSIKCPLNSVLSLSSPASPHPYVHHPDLPSSLQPCNHNRTLSFANNRIKNEFHDYGFRLPFPCFLFLSCFCGFVGVVL